MRPRWGLLAMLLFAGAPAAAVDHHIVAPPVVSDAPVLPRAVADVRAPRPAAVAAPEPRERWVFLVHGILMGKSSMAYLEERLRADGFAVVNRSYPSTSLTIQESADFLRRRIRRRTAAHPQIEVNLVTHSMGGLVARYYLTHWPPAHFGALVQIAPPNHGSERATRFGAYFPYRWLYREPGQQLVNGFDALQAELGAPRVRLGIIAGGTGDNEGFSPAIPGDDDGTNSVESTKLATMTDHIVLRHSHAFIMKKRETADQVIAFLRYGRFRRDTPADDDHALVAGD